MTQPDSVPVELVTALVASGGLGGQPQILIGALPGWVVNRIPIPSGARVLGSAFLNNTVVGVFRTQGQPENVIADLKASLLKQEWKDPPPPPNYGGGFRPAPPDVGAAPTRVMLCGNQQTLNASANRTRDEASEVTIRVTSASQYQCNPPRTPAGFIPSPYPTLFNPSQTSMGNCNEAGGWSGTTTQLSTPMDPLSILDHYAAQLRDSGWTALDPNGASVGRVFTKVDSAGSRLELALTVAPMAHDPSCRDVRLSTRTSRKP